MSNSLTNGQQLPLEGIRVVDLGVSVAVPFATLWLALMGAEVILLETRKRVFHRHWPPFAEARSGDNRSGIFNLMNVGKKSCTLDLRNETGRELAERLIRISDVVVENFSRGTMDKLGLGYERLSRLKPDLIMLSLTAFGRSGPMRDYVGFHSAVLLYSGLAAITGYPGGHPRVLGSVFPDPVSGAYAVFALLQALYYRRHTGLGQHIDLAMHEAMLSLMPQAVMDYTLNHRQPERIGNADPVKAPHGVYPCRDEDTWVAISVADQKEWESLCQVAKHPEWTSDVRFQTTEGRRAHQGELDGLITLWTRQHEPHDLMRRLQEAGVAAGPSYSAEGILKDRHLQERAFVQEIDHPEVGPRATVGLPWHISDTPPPVSDSSPLLGQHTEHVLHHLLGLSEDETKRLVQEGIAC